MNEQTINELIHKMYVETKQFYKISLMDIYGKQIERFIGGLIIILHAYMQNVISEKRFLLGLCSHPFQQ